MGVNKVVRLEAEVELLTKALKQITCEHSNRSGGNDYMMCWSCGLEWDYRKGGPPTPQQIAAKALVGKLWTLQD